jgi:uncharacterized protein (TIGR02680 family)
MLPTPSSERWKPLRAGLVDMFYYDAEEFWFHDGRLLLRGNNGTGKSKVLALTLPFLLDGELAPHRVEPDGDRQKKMEWNLLLGGRHPHSERLGYAWLEFGRRAADGTSTFRTIGCGLKAVAGRGIARHWFFVTTQRVGEQLHLLPSSRVPLTREKLREEIDGHGLLYDRAADYRRAVDETLFGLGEHRYETLINLLIQLRQPQLSKKPDERLLSRALTEALPPLSPGLVTTVAEAFRGLDEERDALRALAEARGAATEFLRHYRKYAQVAAKRKAAGPRQAQSRYEQLGRDLTAAEDAYAAADAKLQAAQGELEELERERTRLEARREALQRDSAMNDARELDRRRENARQHAETATEREAARDRLTGDLARLSGNAEEAGRRVSASESKLHAAQGTADRTATAARCAPDHRTAVEGWREDLTRARRAAHEVVNRQAAAIGQLDRLVADVTARSSAFETARSEVERLTAEIYAATDRIGAAEHAAAARAAELTADYRAYQGGLVELWFGDPDELINLVEEWAAVGEGENPARRVIDDAARSAVGALSSEDAQLAASRDAFTAKAAELTAEIARLEDGGHDAPRPPHTRDPMVRDSRPGAPLWKVTDFAPGVPEQVRAGLEAALEAAGILDAWLTPEGDLVAGDVVLVSGRDPVAGPSCDALLVPAVNTGDLRAGAVPEVAVRAALSGIGLGQGAANTWVNTDGRWANGVLAGSWHKDAAGHIGEGAREAARRNQIARLTAELEEATAAATALDAARGELGRRRDRLAAEHRAAPPDGAVREAHTKAAEQRKRRQELRDSRTEAQRVCAAREEEMQTARVAADEFGADTGLPPDPQELAAVRDGLADYRVALAALWPEAEAFETARQRGAEAAEEVAETQRRLTETAEWASAAAGKAAAAEAFYEALLETVGVAVEELNRKLDELRTDTERRNTNEKAARKLEQQAISDRGNAEGTRDTLRTEIEEATRARDAAVVEFQLFAATGVLRIALPDLEVANPAEPWPPTRAVILARAVNAALEDTDDADAPWDRVQRRVTEEHKLLADAMARYGHSAGLTVRDGIMAVDVVFQGRSHDVPGLADALGEEVEQRARLLSAREREILENHLLNEVAGTLHELITAAEAEVRAMNDELESRPTSTGMKLRLIWQQAREAPDGLDQVRHKLRQTIDAWSSDDRATVGSFLQQRIAAEHASNPAVGWAEALTAALDYRRWHEFVIQRHHDGQWRPATGPASGGERALVASVPLFAAASAYYKSAGNPNAPRLIALDEAFAGVDDDSRAKCLGLLATFDMDVVMTSEREWGCYPQVPGLGICQLARQDGVDAVLVTPWRWDGRERRPAESAAL